ncbi:MAG: hypothetical protein NW220_00055 [Leptolyngbyaceae cyanobacterium bins.349]|nr:hypothetical protein [Leptolyngbyaceae cyanobacterium bins.349]
MLAASFLVGQQLLAQEWQPVRGGTLYGMSGMATVKHQPERLELLVVHDNKQPDQGRLGLVAIAGHTQPQYTPIPWQPKTELPLDLEALAAVPGTATYMASTSSDRVYHFSLSNTADTVSGANGGVTLGTDDEAMGASVFIAGRME